MTRDRNWVVHSRILERIEKEDENKKESSGKMRVKGSQ
jgi:hypothetical protein